MISLVLSVFLPASLLVGAGPVSAGTVEVLSPYSRWENGPSTDPSFFPIGVWLQDPKDAKAYKAAGINLYIGLWNGPTKEQLNQLKIAKMPVICEQNEIGLLYKEEKIIVGWMQGDEPDNAQPLPFGFGHGAPVEPSVVQNVYSKLKSAEPTRPVFLNLGQGVAWDGWWGRGLRSGHPEDYPEYVEGCDIAAFDIYPVSHPRKEVAGNLWYVAEGVKRLIAASHPPKIVWNIIETTGIHSTKRPTPAQVKAEVWMSIIHGSRGIVYFVHEWVPEFSSRALLKNPEMFKAVSAINAQIRELAPVLNSTEPSQNVQVFSSNPEVPLASLEKSHGGSVYLLVVAMRDGPTKATFRLSAPVQSQSVEVLGESRTLRIGGIEFSDNFTGYSVHLYRIKK